MFRRGSRFDDGDKYRLSQDQKEELECLVRTMIDESVAAERERCKAIYEEQTDHQLREFTKALEEADHWHENVGVLLDLIRRDSLSDPGKDTLDQIDGEYQARCLEIKETAARCREIFEKAKANAQSIAVMGAG